MDKQINENPSQQDTLDSKVYSKIKSKSRQIYSSVREPNFIRHNHKTNLNLPPPNWLKSEGESYGIRYTTGDLHDFSSFQMANMFLEYIDKVDIVSNAENIKNLCKMEYDKKSVSIMVHRIDNTFLLDEFDIEKHLINVTNEKWGWLKKFFYNDIVRSADTKVKCITNKQNDFRRIQHKALVSKFLHHSIAIDAYNYKVKNNIFHNETSPISSPLPKTILEETFPDGPQKYQLFNRNVLWDFGNLQMLIGTDLPVFKSCNNSSLSARLRDMSKPLSKLTGIDYWLDNLMCDIPETELCYHINGIVQKYELVKTEDLPSLKGSTFSPENINNKMQYTLSFLKSNANCDGHTYWLFKGKNDKTLKLYDLTTLRSESLIDSINPFTVPVTRLLCHVACKLRDNFEDGKPYNAVTIIHLLKKCLKLLDETKYPQAVTFINNMLSDIYIAVYNNPLTNLIADSTYLGMISVNSHVHNNSASTNFDRWIYSVDLQNESISGKKENITQKPEYSTTNDAIITIDYIYNAMYYIGHSLSCLQSIKNDKDIPVELHLRRVLFERASNAYLILGRKCFKSNNYGIALKCFRRSLEYQMYISNTQNISNSLRVVLEYCGDCFLSIFNFWDKIEQYTSELETDEVYEVELRETLIFHSKHFTNKDLNLIPTRLDQSRESLLNAAEQCYLRVLELETNIKKKTHLNKLIGRVYSEYATFYIREISNAIQNNIPLTPIKLKWLRRKSEKYFTLGSDIFKKIDDKSNFVTIHRNLACVYRDLAGYSSTSQIYTKEFIKEDNLYLKAVNIYTKSLSELKNRNSDPKLWDIVFYELFSVQYYLSVQNYLALRRDGKSNFLECIHSFVIALEHCDLENDTPNRIKYEFQAAIINLGLASLYSSLLQKCIVNKKFQCLDNILHQIKIYYINSFELYFKIDCPVKALEVLVKMIKLDMSFINGIVGVGHIKHVESILKTLKKCDAVFMFLGKKDTMRYAPTLYQVEEFTIESELKCGMNKLTVLKMLFKNVCNLLKFMIKMAMTKTLEWLADKEDELKTIYSVLLRKTVGDDYSQLMVTVKQLSMFGDD